ncbi:MAG: DUF4153 domain-containing protein, partial [Zoogloeaceae bacterium]|nr:DUF4153 domain-containing protein [Zoogloeaceae bacterium]
LFWFIARLVFFFKLQSQCGTEEKAGKWQGRLAALCWLAALPMLVLATYGLTERIAAYGLTPWRVWALFVNLVAAIFVLGYAAHALPRWRRFRGVEKTNLAAVGVIVAGIVLLNSGLIDPYRLSINSQLQRMAAPSTEVTADAISFFRKYGSIHGKIALLKLASYQSDAPSGRFAHYAALALSAEDYWKAQKFTEQAMVRDALQTLRVYPGQEEIPPDLIEAFAKEYYDWESRNLWTSNDAQPAPVAALFWKIQLAPEEPESYIFLTRRQSFPYPYSYSGSNGDIWQKVNADTLIWQRTGRLRTTGCTQKPEAENALFAAVLANTAQLVPVSENEILVDGIRIRPEKREKFDCNDSP